MIQRKRLAFISFMQKFFWEAVTGERNEGHPDAAPLNNRMTDGMQLASQPPPSRVCVAAQRAAPAANAEVPFGSPKGHKLCEILKTV